MIPSFPAPVLASGLDLIGVLFFVVVAIISAMSKKAQQGPLSDEDETPRPTRRPAPRRAAPPAGPAPDAPPPVPETTIEGEMRRFLEEMRRAQEPARPEPPPPPVPSARPVFVPRKTPTSFSPPKSPSRAPRRAPVPMPVEEEGGEGPQTPALADTAPDLRAELGRSLETLHQEMEVTHTELREVAPASVVEGAVDRAGTRFDPSAFRTPESARQAVLLSEILGLPRALKPW